MWSFLPHDQPHPARPPRARHRRSGGLGHPGSVTDLDAGFDSEEVDLDVTGGDDSLIENAFLGVGETGAQISASVTAPSLYSLCFLEEVTSS